MASDTYRSSRKGVITHPRSTFGGSICPLPSLSTSIYLTTQHQLILQQLSPVPTPQQLNTTSTLVCTDTTTWYHLNSPKVETRLGCDVMLKQAANKQQREPRKQGERESLRVGDEEEENVVACGDELEVAETHICSRYISSLDPYAPTVWLFQKQ